MCPVKSKSASANKGTNAAPLEPRADSDLEERDRQRFAAIVREIEQKFGYTVAAIPPPRENPYANMTHEQALKIAIDAGIVSKSGKLGKIYR